eukprot:2279099-Pyramimonas_sp.AAC.1
MLQLCCDVGPQGEALGTQDRLKNGPKTPLEVHARQLSELRPAVATRAPPEAQLPTQTSSGSNVLDAWSPELGTTSPLCWVRLL